eukprot:XP_001707078.1 Hypothetical protein GL50803_37843 [Giardia lamblia ATCC 50803]
MQLLDVGDCGFHFLVNNLNYLSNLIKLLFNLICLCFSTINSTY